MLIVAKRVLVGSGRYLKDGAVLIEGDTIRAVGPEEAVVAEARPGTERVAFDGTLLPGLIDAHVHLAFDGGPDPVATLSQSSDESLLADMRKRAEDLLRSGVTTARDLGDRNGLVLRLASEIDEGAAVGPRLVSAGTPLTTPEGHCHFLGGEVAGEEDIRALVRRNVAAGAGVIKAMVTGGGLTKGGPRSWESQFSADDLAVLVEESHAAGLPVAAHAHGTPGITAAVAAGVDTIEHCTWMAGDGFDFQEEVVARIVEKGIAVCPAVSPHWQMLPRFFGEEKAHAMFDLVRRMAEAGVKLIAGTDAGVQRASFDGLVPALSFYAHLGLQNGRILDMATSIAAEALGLGRTTGRIAAGYKADLVVVDGDPLADLNDLSAIRTVICAGRPLEGRA
ncbi:amidohydrolase family protein [Streptomyces sp. NPDC047974]|uniref:amidohydrolase family protein n=1 Tax=Streptomyces sp. NPDC047974 TaxID=3154343 RepID=UPI0033C27343